MAARLCRLVQGYSGISPATAEILTAMLNARIHPVTPMTGSLGEADLAPLAHIAAVVLGAGDAEWMGTIVDGASALAEAQLRPPVAGPKDALALVSSNAASVGLACLAVYDARRALASLLAAACLSLEGFRANQSPLSQEAVELHPVPGFRAVSERIRDALADGDLSRAGAARRLQDPLSFRCLGPVHGVAVTALGQASDAIELELNSSDDNPAILGQSRRALPNASFDATHLALACETLSLALARVSVLSGQRILQLMSPETSDLPRFLAPPLPGRSGFSALQKTVSALVAEIQLLANPVPAVILPVANHIEDYGSMALSSVQKVAGIGERIYLLASIELIVAAQACDLRRGVKLGKRTRELHQFVREFVPTLDDDRASSPDVSSICHRLKELDTFCWSEL
jgi:histidine ammonia-lyase